MADPVKRGYLISAIATLIGSIVGLMIFPVLLSMLPPKQLESDEDFWKLTGSLAIVGWWIGSIVCCWLSLKLLKYERARPTAIWTAVLMILNAACSLMSLQLIWFTLLPFTFGVGGLARWIVMRR